MKHSFQPQFCIDFYSMISTKMLSQFKSLLFLFLFVFLSFSSKGQVKETDSIEKFTTDYELSAAEKYEGVGSDIIEGPTPWFRKLTFRGYAQVRYNRLLETNSNLRTDYDASVGDGGGFLIRRIRPTFEGNISKRVYIYIHPDVASGSGVNRFSLRSAFFDVALDDKNEFRVRFGQTKVPFGFENQQSSQKRLTLDRSESHNSAVQTERDLGVFVYWAPLEIRKRLAWLVSSGLKGTGDYGVFGFAAYNGMTANRDMEKNDLHVAAKASYPFQFESGQVLETGISAYTGRYPVNTTLVDDNMFKDERVAASFIYYPQPFGFQGEYNVGTGPRYNAELNTVEETTVYGGYLQTMYYIRTYDLGLMIPFVKWHSYEGGFKHRPDARSQSINEWEIGLEWQPNYYTEVVVQYTISRRDTADSINPFNEQQGRFLRVQLQVNF